MSTPKGIQVVHNVVTIPVSTPIATAFSVGTIPGGHRVKSVEAYNTALGASVTLSLGVTGSPTLFTSLTAAATAGKISMTDLISGGVGNTSSNARTMIVQTGGAITGTAGTVDVYVTTVQDYT